MGKVAPYAATIAADVCRLEPAEYRREMVSLEAYDGRTLQAQIYTVDDSLPEDEPSQRYLDIIISGATKAGLKDDYIQKLRARPVYTPPHWVLKVREKRPKLSELKPITVEELSKHKTDGDVWCGSGQVSKYLK